MCDQYQIYSNLFLMINYRGAEPSSPKLTQEVFTKTLNNDEYVVIEAIRKNTDVRGAACVHICMIDKKSKYSTKSSDFDKLINDIIKTAKISKDMSLEIPVISDTLETSHIKKKIANIHESHSNVFIEYLSHEIFLIELPKHILVPKHEIISLKETDELCKRLFINKMYFQRILSTDPMAIWLGIKPGMFVKITRLSDLCGLEIAYRICSS